MLNLLKHLFVIFRGIIISFAILVVSIVVAISVLVGDLLSPSTQSLERGSLVEISMNNLIVDTPATSPLRSLQVLGLGQDPTISILDLSMAIEAAAADPNITALSLRMDGEYSLSLALASEVRNLLIDFKKMSGKPIYAYAEEYSQVEYYLASVADSIYLHPQGLLLWQGVAANGLFFGDLLREFDVTAEVFRPEACTYKSAVEPYISNEMSEQSRQQNQRIVSHLWDGVVSEVSQSREINEATLRAVARDQILVEPDQALAAGMVDGLCYRDEYDSYIEALGVVTDGKSNSLRRVSMAQYASHIAQRIEESNLSAGGGKSKIAVIYAEGAIVNGDRLNGSGQESVVSGVVVRQLRRARNDEDVKAVIVRVNSPGGGALAADVIWREMELLRSVKPLIVSFGAYAASGGYYMSAPADIIITSPYTLTGSIGVYGVMFAYEDAMRQRLKISTDGVVSSPSADFGRVARDITPLERAAMMRSVNNVYDAFQGCVIKGRHLSSEAVAAVSGGRVWSGSEAIEIGLADGVGGIRQALIVASERCGIPSGKVEIVEYIYEEDIWDTSLASMLWSRVSGVLFGSTEGDLLLREAREVQYMLEHGNHVMMLSPERIHF